MARANADAASVIRGGVAAGGHPYTAAPHRSGSTKGRSRTDGTGPIALDRHRTQASALGRRAEASAH